MVKVCDMIPGGGKSSAAITYMGEHKEDKFLYVTPYNDETKRIQTALPELRFCLPDARWDRESHTKREHLKDLLRDGRNVSMTHVLLGLCDDEAIELIREGEYIIIIDEAINVLSPLQIPKDDVKIAMGSEFFSCVEDNGQFKLVENIDSEYRGNWLADMKFYAKSHRLFYVNGEDELNKLFVWRFNRKILEAAKGSFVLTYFFKASTTYYMFQEEGISYQVIGVVRDNDGTYRFSEAKCWTPPYILEMGEKIHILDNERMNAIGNRENAFSISWQKDASRYRNGKDKRVETVKKNLTNYFNNIHRGVPSEQKLWSSYNKPKAGGGLGNFAKDVGGKGYANRFLTFNQKATNKYSNAKVLAYCMNVYVPGWLKDYYTGKDIEVYEDDWALSTLVQWIWRSAIRNGEEIWLYLPSRRMREILESWIDMVTNGNAMGSHIGDVVIPKANDTDMVELQVAKPA